MKRPTFYNPALDVQTKEERFLLKRRIRLMDKLRSLKGGGDLHGDHKIRILTRKLKYTEQKLRKL